MIRQKMRSINVFSEAILKLSCFRIQNLPKMSLEEPSFWKNSIFVFTFQYRNLFQKMIRWKMIIKNVSREAILRNIFASIELKVVRGPRLKLHLASINYSYVFFIKCGIVFILQKKRSLLKYNIALLYKYLFVPCRDMPESDQLCLGDPRGEVYKEAYVLECLLIFTEVTEFVSSSLLSTASF